MNVPRDIELGDDPCKTATGAGRNVIAVIGIDRYHHHPQLHNAVNDAKGTGDLFSALGFEQAAPPLLDDAATREAIQRLVVSDLNKLGSEDSLVVFFAGHGTIQVHHPSGETVQTGYLAPVDAAGDPSSLIELESWIRAISRLPARHILVIIDACRGGIALEAGIQPARGDFVRSGTGRIELEREAPGRADRNNEFEDDEPSQVLRARRSRKIIASAMAHQQASDHGHRPGHSLFTSFLIDALTKHLPKEGRTTTGTLLGIHLQKRVDKKTRSKQTPIVDRFDRDDFGEMFIPLPRDATPSLRSRVSRLLAPRDLPLYRTTPIAPTLKVELRERISGELEAPHDAVAAVDRVGPSQVPVSSSAPPFRHAAEAYGLLVGVTIELPRLHKPPEPQAPPPALPPAATAIALPQPPPPPSASDRIRPIAANLRTPTVVPRRPSLFTTLRLWGSSPSAARAGGPEATSSPPCLVPNVELPLPRIQAAPHPALRTLRMRAARSNTPHAILIGIILLVAAMFAFVL